MARSSLDPHDVNTEPKVALASTDPVNTSTGAETPASVPQPTPGPDPFDLARYRIDPAKVQASGVKKLRVTVPVRKPHAQEWFMVHPDEDYRTILPLIILKEDREEYIVSPEIWAACPDEVTLVTLYTCVNRQGIVFLWPVKLPTQDGRRNEWTTSARECAESAMLQWSRMKANMDLGAYEISVAPGITAEPVWPKETLNTLVEIAFRGHIINDLDHPVTDRLQGKV